MHPFHPCFSQLHGPLDVSVNKATKDYLKWQFQEWYSNQILKQLDKGTEVEDLEPVDL